MAEVYVVAVILTIVLVILAGVSIAFLVRLFVAYRSGRISFPWTRYARLWRSDTTFISWLDRCEASDRHVFNYLRYGTPIPGDDMQVCKMHE